MAPRRAIFHAAGLDDELRKSGFVTLPWLSLAEVDQLAAIIERENAQAYDPCDVHVKTPFQISAFNNNASYKAALYDAIYGFLRSRVDGLLRDYTPLVVNVFTKNPHTGDNSVAIHQNPSFVEEPSLKSVSVWIPLLDACKQNGTLGVLRGSQDCFYQYRAGNMPETTYDLCARKLIEEWFEPLDVPKGSAVVLDDSLIHWSYPNYSDEVRTAVQLICVPREAPHIYYYYNTQGAEPMVDMFELDKDFFFRFNCKEQPHGLPKIGSKPYRYHMLTKQEVVTGIARNNPELASRAQESLRQVRPNPPEVVADYYDQFTDQYLATTGDFIQAFRPKDTNVLMQYIEGSAAVSQGEHLLDAGCGVGAASIWLAKRSLATTLEALTISPRQAEIARARVAAAGLDGRVQVSAGDYHRLAELFGPGVFDGVLFLESLGHSHDVGAVIEGVAKVLKPGGWLYLKDFFRRESGDPDEVRKTTEVIELIDENYAYNTLSLSPLLRALSQHGFRIEFVREPKVEPSIEVTVLFEDKTARRTYPAFMAHHALDWFEIRATLAPVERPFTGTPAIPERSDWLARAFSRADRVARAFDRLRARRWPRTG